MKAVRDLNDWDASKEEKHLPTNNAEIKSIFSVGGGGRNPKSVIKSTRKSTSDAPTSKHQPLSDPETFDFYKKEEGAAVTSRQKVLLEKEQRKREEQEKREQELQRIRLENMRAGQEAKQKEMAQYRPSTAMRNMLGDEEKSRKIEEERDMFEEDRDLEREMEQEKEGELEDIPEELDEDEEEDPMKRVVNQEN